VSYDVEFISIELPAKTSFPVDAEKAKALVKKTSALPPREKVAERLLKVAGCKPGPDDAIDYMGKVLNYARLTIKKDRIHLENNCNPAELLKLYQAAREVCPHVVIRDLQTQQLHDPASWKAWWSRPL
jgi:hypothetical protein